MVTKYLIVIVFNKIRLVYRLVRPRFYHLFTEDPCKTLFNVMSKKTRSPQPFHINPDRPYLVLTLYGVTKILA